MNPRRPSFWILAAFSATAVVFDGLAAAPKAAPAPRPVGEKIEFTQPREPAPMKPMTGTDIQGRNFNSARRDAPAEGIDLLASMPLPPPSDVNRLRLLQELVGRRSLADDSNPGLSDRVGMRLEDGMDADAGSTRISIEDLFDRQRGRLGGDADERGDNRRSGTGRDERGSDRGRERERDGSGRRDSPEPPDSRDSTSSSESSSGTAKRGSAESGQSQRFLPDIQAREKDFRDSLLGNRREVDDTLGVSSERLSTRFGLGTREGEDPTRAREERMEAFRRILGGGTTVDSWLSPATRSAMGDPKAGAGGVGVPGASTGGARTLGAALEGRGGPGGMGGGPGGEMAGDRTFSMPSRPLELNLGVGPAKRGGLDSAVGSPAPALRPMELFQRKHDTRLPTRGF